ncbi:IucA/IucC family siderophore biosynthesis protein [Streptomyces filamentosus]|uniref:IucA/IucC family siderophore biosynthesis protein n=3 Tax=Streptomyces TaxID=1883 RepID=A0ABY4UQL2_STRFL|nr:IucA/IucC family siderophore biosynthesis protein [Streptomyces filamentosus]EFE78091.1 IucA/IucC [Streptomyces filamentosus NRRL 15998]EWS95008.1 rhizobactin siderophore biosynthesis protein rhbF [Streptomyces filamentosus NRRL 11379]MYR81988.1 IucA/IucC family siderophore biosynthesis protein [Streptomyces sp. SID5466]USC46555.1 IucA/IucC family siderophore biosynthesis protein [Streptomyces filamentosus]
MPISPTSRDAAESPQLFSPPELNRQIWDRAAARLLAKMLGEFAYEKIIEPVPGSGTGGLHRLTLDDGGALAFTARRGVYGSWRVDPESIEITAQPPAAAQADGSPAASADVQSNGSAATRADAQSNGSPAASADAQSNGSPAASRPFRDPLTFLTRARDLLGLDGTTLGHLIRELTLTLSADARLDHTALTADRLAALDYAELEGHQTGHPWLVASKGRLGFSAADAARFTPETRSPLRLPWIAVSTRIAQFRGVGRVSTPDQLYAGELDPDVREAFADVLRARGHDPEDYFYLPVHPWQWDEWIVPLFAPAIADGDIVALHTDGDARLPQQSIRTFANVERPERHTVKLPLSILNTLVWRGLPTERTLAAPAVTSWVQGLCEGDPFLRDTCRVILLGEVASVAVEHPLYDHLPEAPYQYKELLGAIWREPLPPRLAPGERARTLASLLHTDPTGRAFTAELVERSGLAPETWLKRLFAALLPPLLHFLYRYGTVFSPHGENAIVVFDENDVPVRLAIKDFVDDVNVSAHPLPEHDTMPDEVRAVLLTEEPSFLTQFIHSGLFVGVFRYLSPLCEDQLGVSEDTFWSLVRAEIVRHHARFPELKERFELFDMLTPEIERLCLNRNRLHVDGYRDRASRPHAAIHGTVPNPLHLSARVRE